jgi:hypothetical protein
MIFLYWKKYKFLMYLERLLVVIVMLFHSNYANAQSGKDIVSCSLRNSGLDYVGICAVPCPVNALKANFDNLLQACNDQSPPRLVKANLKKIDSNGNFLGKMEGKYPEDPTRFEITDNQYIPTKVAKLPFGWFPIETVTENSDQLMIMINATHVLPPTPDDIKILDRALDILSSKSIWNKNDNRLCPPNPEKWSLFCALTQATVEVSGGVHYRQPAHEKVREVLNEVGGNRVKTHRLMDYNNHPDTTFEDVRNLLIEARKRIKLNEVL